MGEDVSDDDDDDRFRITDVTEVQFACTITRKPFRVPVATQCGHFFEEKAALSNYGKSSKCFTCGKPTYGVFNKATKLISQLALREEKLRESGNWPPAEWSDVSPDQHISYIEMQSKLTSKVTSKAKTGTIGQWGTVAESEGAKAGGGAAEGATGAGSSAAAELEEATAPAAAADCQV